MQGLQLEGALRTLQATCRVALAGDTRWLARAGIETRIPVRQLRLDSLGFHSVEIFRRTGGRNRTIVIGCLRHHTHSGQGHANCIWTFVLYSIDSSVLHEAGMCAWPGPGSGKSGYLLNPARFLDGLRMIREEGGRGSQRVRRSGDARYVVTIRAGGIEGGGTRLYGPGGFPGIG